MAKEFIESPMPGVIRNVDVAIGDQVNEGDVLCTLEAMKMENPIVATIKGKIVEVNISAGQPVKRGEKMIAIESQQ